MRRDAQLSAQYFSDPLRNLTAQDRFVTVIDGCSIMPDTKSIEIRLSLVVLRVLFVEYASPWRCGKGETLPIDRLRYIQTM